MVKEIDERIIEIDKEIEDIKSKDVVVLKIKTKESFYA